jgi:hypothetical protein
MKAIIAIAAIAALSMTASAFAQQAKWSQPGDYYAADESVVHQPTSQDLSQGDYYAPGRTMVEQPRPQEIKQNRQGDYYTPNNN